jgi:hypothetical protein
MSYRAIKYDHIADPAVRTIFHRADLYIGDAYSMFFLPYKGWRSGGACNFSIVLNLLCVVDGIARDIYPTELKVPDHEQRFKKLLREKLFWGPPRNGWMDQAVAAKQLYLEFRNPLVHELGKDRPSSARSPMFAEPIIGKWGPVPQAKQNIDRIDRLKNWDISWPTMFVQKVGKNSRVKLASAALYWSVKQMVADLARSAA